MAHETIVRLKITGVAHTPEQITQTLGIPCNKSWRIGDKRANTVIVEKNNGWVLSSDLPKSASLEAHIEKMLERLATCADRMQVISQKDSVELSCVVYATTPPALNFNKRIIQQLNELGASLDVDLYLLDLRTELS